ncbi:hypothetical protein PF010_g14368 [Phytophthora fragariae]|uniref:Uncharacterized protein n=2 Tax=Phytophthora TaxID=4783 RepID=A0A6A3RR25_9STRA|nr:hypothetical protein PF003_g25233 [Phytophthora fragariae]KAE9101492.1 hypothetical protein PF007_g15126 [Phytophthora fragariae]KAE9101691.1 hypothetical protein PF010_g14368 [Phytophthora fragariae]KAE9303449.1 hypothetical protein PR003_g22002 [Phytophthora rubi]
MAPSRGLFHDVGIHRKRRKAAQQSLHHVDVGPASSLHQGE